MGKLIVIEGLDGSGKSTQVELLCERLGSLGTAFTRIKLPDYDSPSSTLVKMYLSGEFGSSPDSVNAYAASAFYAVDRVASFLRGWRDVYDNGGLIIADRYTTSNACHQLQKLPRGQWNEYLEWLVDFEYNKLGIPAPSSVIYLDMPVEVSQRLMSSRYGGDESKKDIHEADIAYLTSCRDAALYAADKLGWNVVRCAAGGEPRSISDIGEEIRRLASEAIINND